VPHDEFSTEPSGQRLPPALQEQLDVVVVTAEPQPLTPAAHPVQVDASGHEKESCPYTPFVHHELPPLDATLQV